MIFSLTNDIVTAILTVKGAGNKKSKTDKADATKVAIVLAGNDKKSAVVWTAKLRRLDKMCGGVLATATAAGYVAKAGAVCELYPTESSFSRLFVVGCGDDSDIPEVVRAVEGIIAKLSDKVKTIGLLSEKNTAVVAEAVAAGAYRYHLGGSSAQPTTPTIKKVFVEGKISAKQLAQAAATGEGVRLTRHLAEQPPNICTPTYLATTAKRLGRECGLRIKIIERKEMERLGMGGLLAVSQGSAQPPKLIIMEHTPRTQTKKPPIVLVGKGVTFDTGGISIKPAAAMDEMKFDMSGAASVFGTMLSCARLKLPQHVIGIVPTCENMPDGKAVKPGDVIKMHNGKTVEVLNTDAEGRLILGDALAYSARYKPSTVLDMATLTGACVIALGAVNSGLMGNDNSLAKELLSAGNASHDGCWQLPLGKEYDKLLKSDYADLANIGGRTAGTITAACFLSHFVDCKSWAHLDIAGTAWNTKKRATGRPVPLLMEFLCKRARG